MPHDCGCAPASAGGCANCASPPTFAGAAEAARLFGQAVDVFLRGGATDRVPVGGGVTRPTLLALIERTLSMTGGTVLTAHSVTGAQAATFPEATHLLISGYHTSGDGGGGLATPNPTGEEPWFVDGGGRQWFMADEVRDVRMYGVRANGSDETAAFAKAAAYKGVVILPKLARPYVLSGSIPVHAQMLRSGDYAEIHLTTSGMARGLWIQSGSALEARIRRTSTAPYVGSGSGAFNNAVFIGTDAHTAAETVDWRLDVEIESVGSAPNVVTILGNVHRGRIDRLSVEGDFENSILFHWWWVNRISSILGTTCHPRDIVMRDVRVRGGDGISGAGLIFSGVHDIGIDRIRIDDCIIGLIVQAGDMGGTYANGPSAGRVLSGIEIGYMSTDNIRDSSLRVNGYGYPLVGGKRWLMTDHPCTGVRIGTLVCVRGASSEAVAAVRFRMARNCHIGNLVDSLAEDADPARLFSGAMFEAAVDCSASGATSVARGAHVVSGRNLRAELAATCPISAGLTNNYVGVLAGGSVISVTLAAAVPPGAEQATFAAVETLVFPGMLFAAGGALFEFAEGFYFDANTPPGPVSLRIRPAPVALSSGAAAALLTGAYDVQISGRYEGFWAGLRIASADGRTPRDLTFQGVTERCAMYGVYAAGGANLAVLNSAFDFNGWAPEAAEAANIRFDGVCAGVTIMGNSYNAKGGAGVAFNAYIRATVSAVVNVGNRHYPLNEARPTHGADYYQGAGNTDRAAGLSWYHPSITNKGG